MYAVIGLGNPGPRYEHTRHNAGRDAVRELAALLGEGNAAWEQRSGCSVLRARSGGESFLLILPERFMNLSGEAAAPVLAFYKVPPEQVIVVYDELDFDLGTIRLKFGGSSGGHRGVENILRRLNTDQFFRVRIGIGHPRRAAEPQHMDVSSWVLARPTGSDADLFRSTNRRAAESVLALAQDGLERAQQQFHG